MSPAANKKEQTPSLSKVRISRDQCKGCKLCVEYCPTHHLILSDKLNKRGVNFAKVNPDCICTGCGCCFLICPESCIEISKNK